LNFYASYPFEQDQAAAGVTSINGETGAITLVAGTGISITPSGQNITITNTSPSSGGTVTSVGLADGSTTPIFSISGSPVTGSGTLTETLITQTANTVFAGPATGSAAQPTFRALVAADIPTPISGFTAGSVLFAGSSGQIAQDNAEFFWNNTNFSLGLGTAVPASNTVIDIVNSSGAAKSLRQTGYGTGSSVGIKNQFARGTVGTPTAAQTGDLLSFISGTGYGTSFPSSTGVLNIVAGENFTGTSNATYMQFEVTPTGSVTKAEAMRLNSTGNLLINTTTDSGTQKLQVNGNSNVGTVTAGVWNGTATNGSAFLTTGGPGTYTTPSNTTTATNFKFTLIGGGGAGGATGTTIANSKGSGGGAGGTCIVYLNGIAGGTALTIAIGSLGTGVLISNGNPGGNTTLTVGSTTYTASGGAGGTLGITGPTLGGVGGTVTNGTIQITGQNGFYGGAAGAGDVSGFGGSTMFGSGGPSVGSPATGSNSGNPGTGYGSGGGGSAAGAATVSGSIGGNGTNGCILVEWQN
jgi:hypothetical protein